MPTMPNGYYNRFNAADQYDAHLFKSGSVLQSAELNEIQDETHWRVRRIGDAVFKDGSVIRNGKVILGAVTNGTVLATAEAGDIYLRGAVRSIPARTFTVPETCTIGVYLTETVVSELENVNLRDPAIGSRNFGEPGASRLQVTGQWGYSEDAQDGSFYPIYAVENGTLLPNQGANNNSAIAIAISRYDRQSSGGFYVVSGMDVSKLQDANGQQVYSIQEGEARVNGAEIQLPASYRVAYDATPTTQLVNYEPHAITASPQTITLNFAPVASIVSALVIKQTDELVTRGLAGGIDNLSKTSVSEVVSVVKGATTYVRGVDYEVSAYQINWSLGGAEPAPGETYTVTYKYNENATPDSVSSTGCVISGGVIGSTALISYNAYPPRIDRLCLNSAGKAAWVQGVPHLLAPTAPLVPAGLLPLATVYQTWDADRKVEMIAPRVVPMSSLESMQRQINDLYSLIADQRLLNNALISDPTSKRGVFVDPFLDNDMRDSGLSQNAEIVGGELTLGITEHVVQQSLRKLNTPIAEWINRPALATHPLTLVSGTPVYLIAQTLRTSTKQVNPYMAFTPLPAGAIITPAVDFWTSETTEWKPSTTSLVVSGSLTENQLKTATQWIGKWINEGKSMDWISKAIYAHSGQLIVPTVEEAIIRTSRTTEAKYLRPIEIEFEINGFGSGEILNAVYFDGVSIAFSAI